MVFLKKDAKIGTGRQQERMHLQTPSLLSNDWGKFAGRQGGPTNNFSPKCKICNFCGVFGITILTSSFVTV